VNEMDDQIYAMRLTTVAGRFDGKDSMMLVMCPVATLIVASKLWYGAKGHHNEANDLIRQSCRAMMTSAYMETAKGCDDGVRYSIGLLRAEMGLTPLTGEN
jgi:hypothetical protein